MYPMPTVMPCLRRRSGKNNFPVVEYLLSQHADFNAVTPQQQLPPLFKAGNAADVRYLVEHGANPRHRLSNGDTPLHYVRFYGVARELVRLGADPLAKNAKGQTPLHTAKSAEDAQLFLQHGARLHARDHDGNNARAHAMTSRCNGQGIVSTASSSTVG